MAIPDDCVAHGRFTGKGLIYAARVRSGLMPATRREVFEQIKHLKRPECPFASALKPLSWGGHPKLLVDSGCRC
jgi:hypothetical protein